MLNMTLFVVLYMWLCKIKVLL